MPQIAAIFANLGFWSRLRDDGSETTRFRQHAAKLFRACRELDVAKLNILNVTHEFICENIPRFEDDIQAKTELRTYMSSAGDLRATPHPADFWFAAAQQFPKLSIIALACLSVPCNNVADERSFIIYTGVLRDDDVASRART